MDFLSKNRTTIENRFPALFTSRSSINVPSVDIPTVDVPSVNVPSVDSTDVLFKIWRWINNNSVARTVVGNAIFSDASPQLMAQSLAVLSVKTMAIFAATIGVYFLAKFGIKKHQMYFTMINDHLQKLNPKRLWKLIIEIVNKLINRTKVTIEQEQNTGRDSKLANEFERFKATMQRWLNKWTRKNEDAQISIDGEKQKQTTEEKGQKINRFKQIRDELFEEEFNPKFDPVFSSKENLIQFCVPIILSSSTTFIADPPTLMIALLVLDQIVIFNHLETVDNDETLLKSIKNTINQIGQQEFLKVQPEDVLVVIRDLLKRQPSSIVKTAGGICGYGLGHLADKCLTFIEAFAGLSLKQIADNNLDYYSNFFGYFDIEIGDLSQALSLVAFIYLRLYLTNELIKTSKEVLDDFAKEVLPKIDERFQAIKEVFKKLVVILYKKQTSIYLPGIAWREWTDMETFLRFLNSKKFKF